MRISLLPYFLLVQLLFFFSPLTLHSATERLVLITGCARGATTYIAKLLQAAGIDVKHERLGADGTSCWTLAVDDPHPPWGPSSRGLRFHHVFHQTRHPLDVITSWFCNAMTHETWEFIYRHIPQIRREEKLIIRAAKYWFFWNLRAERKAEWRYRVEDIDCVLEEMALRLGVFLDCAALKKIDRHINRWEEIECRITWNQLRREIPLDLFIKIQQLARKYGYDTEDISFDI